MADLLLEVGVEEMPPGAISPALDQLINAIIGHISPICPLNGVNGWATPRRFLVRISGMPDRQPDQPLEVKGPAWSVAFTEDGKPTQAAIGFARKHGLTPADLHRVETQQGAYAMASTVVKGRSAIELASEIFPAAIRSLSFPKMMRWGDNPTRFVRPIRWILAVASGIGQISPGEPEIIPFELFGVRSGNQSRGHRFLSPEPFEIGANLDLVEALRSRFVIADPIERMKTVKAQGDRCASEMGARILWDEELLQEVINLVEWPTAFIGSFDPDFLKLPRAVLITAMKKHQRFFPVIEKDVDVSCQSHRSHNLLPKFLAVRNGDERGLNIVREGNEHVLASRFADARFFFERDCALSADDLLAKLPQILFQEQLGTLDDKRRRLEWMAEKAAKYMQLDRLSEQHLKSAAHLCKADLASELVTELPALQGVMGAEYARRWGEPEEVATAIEEHYLPRGAGDELPQSPAGKLLAALDRTDTLVGYIGIGIQPRGSSDPFGLRRNAQSIIQIAANERSIPPIAVFMNRAIQAYQEVNGLPLAKDDTAYDRLILDLSSVIDQRLDSYLQENGARYDLSVAVISAFISPTVPLAEIVARARFLQGEISSERFEAIRLAATRLFRILAPTKLADITARPDIKDLPLDKPADAQFIADYLPDLKPELSEKSEQEVHRIAVSITEPLIHSILAGDYESALQLLEQLVAPVNRLFDDVLIMAEDEQVRINRLRLLAMTYNRFKLLADFSRLVAD